MSADIRQEAVDRKRRGMYGDKGVLDETYSRGNSKIIKKDVTS